MGTTAILAERILTPLEDIPDAAVVVEEGRILAVGRRNSITLPAGAREYHARGLTAVPGFVDVHIHGAGGHDVMEATTDALEVIATTVARYGTTSLLATTLTASPDHLCGSLAGLASYIRGQPHRPNAARPRAEFLGIHLEGPFINRARRGVHPAEWIAPPSTGLLERFLDAADGLTRIVTLAPEVPGALELIDGALRHGTLVALGHTDATYEAARAAINRGACHAVHVFNAMRPFRHRDSGVVGAVLTAPEVTAEVIADGVHVDQAAILLLVSSKGVERVLLVSDGTAATGMGDGIYPLGRGEVIVRDGIGRDHEGRLAGTTLTLDRAVRHLVSLGVTQLDAVRMATLNPARRLGLRGKKGILEPGADADLVLLTAELKVAGVMARGVASFL